MPDENGQDQPQIFSAHGPGRGRAMKAVLAGGAVLIVVWLVALGLGVFGGFDALPSFGLGGDDSEKTATEATQPAATQPASSKPAGANPSSSSPAKKPNQSAKPAPSAATHGQSGATHGQSGATHGQSGTTHGQSGTTHGKPAGSGSGTGTGKPAATPGGGNTKALPLGQLK